MVSINVINVRKSRDCRPKVYTEGVNEGVVLDCFNLQKLAMGHYF